jgi:hypothetical protein
MTQPNNYIKFFFHATFNGDEYLSILVNFYVVKKSRCNYSGGVKPFTKLKKLNTAKFKSYIIIIIIYS